MAGFKGLVTFGVVAALVACAHQSAPIGAPAHERKTSPMGMDAFGHTRMSEERDQLSADEKGHAERLIARLRTTLARYRDVRAAEHDGYHRSGDDVPVGQLKHFVNDANVQLAKTALVPDRPMALLYRRTTTGFELAGAMFNAPIGSSMDELNRRVPLALGHWHAHRNICVPKRGHAPLTDTQRTAFGFSGSINTASACNAAGGFFMDNVYGWMTHVYPFEPTLAAQF